MKAISLWQPWASAIAIGLKTNETRSWSTAYRGPLAIHAAKTDNEEIREFWAWKACAPLRERFGRFENLPRGAIVATCRLEEVLHTTDVDGLTEQEKAFGNYSPGRYAWVLTEVLALPTPIPVRGSQGLFEWHAPAGPTEFSLR